MITKKKVAIIIGAGPAGLTAAYELLEHTDFLPIIFESTGDIGGISKTIEYKGNRMDIGGHRFFSKSDRVMDFWKNILPVEEGKGSSTDPAQTDRVMLVRNRISRILFSGKFFDYPITLNGSTLSNLGLICIMKIGFSYIYARLFPIRREDNLEDFFINRFGKQLYLTFFKDYTEKVWGVSCREIKPEWGAQRIKGLSVTKTLLHALHQLFYRDASLNQKNMETSLIEHFYYPKYGPGQLWEEVARQIQEKGGRLHLQQQVIGIQHQQDRVIGVKVLDILSGESTFYPADVFFSTMPVRDLIAAMGSTVPQIIQKTAQGLQYRDFMTVGLLLKKVKLQNTGHDKGENGKILDNWIYIQEKEVKLGRLQIFNNWSPYMVRDINTIFMGLEYFCNEGDTLWSMTDEAFAQFAIDELVAIDVIDRADVLDYTVVRMPKAYPAYFGSYDEFPIIRAYTDSFDNLFLIGRNGMHRYNNADHSMLTAMMAVEATQKQSVTKADIWNVNTEEEYHETRNAKL